MNKRWLIFFLIASLALNVAFIISFSLNARRNPINARKSLDQTASFLDLKADQKTKIQEISKNFHIELIHHKQDIQEKRIEIIEILADPQGERDEINLKLEELNKMQNNMNYLFFDTLIKIGGILDGKQRLDFLYRLSRDWFFTGDKKEAKRTKNGH